MKKENAVIWSNSVFAAHQALKRAENRDYNDERTEKDLKEAIAYIKDALAVDN